MSTWPSYSGDKRQAYAKVVFGWLRDWCMAPVERVPTETPETDRSAAAPLDLSQPVHIVELGCGSGRFAYLFLIRFFDLLIRSHMERIGEAPEDLRQELAVAARRIWETYFPLRDPLDLALHLGVLAIALERWEEGLEYFGYSESVYGEDPATDFNLALCHQGLGNEEAALEQVERALEVDPEMELALALRAELLAGTAGRA